MIPRPKAGESEEDLLKFQQEFLRDKTRSSATVVASGDQKRKQTHGSARDIVQMEGKTVKHFHYFQKQVRE